LLQHEQQLPAAIGKLQLLLVVLRVDVLEFELRRRQHLRETVEILLTGGDLGFHLLRAIPQLVDAFLINDFFLRERQDEHEQDGSESAANAVQKCEAEYFRFAALGGDRHG